jgi:hypothetical protein
MHVNLRTSGDILDINDSGSLSKLDLSKNNLQSEGLSTVSEALKSTSIKQLNIADNQICGLDKWGDGTYDTAGLAALTKSIGNLKELNISSNHLKAEGARVLAPAIDANGSLSSLTFCGHTNKEGEPVTINTAMTEADFSGKKLGIAGAQILAAFMGRKFFQDKGSLSSVNLLKNNIGVDQANALVKIKESKPNLKSLCGFTLEETELDMSKQGLRPGDAVLLASDIADMGSLSKLKFSGSYQERGKWKDGEAVTIDTTMTEADFSGKKLGAAGAQILAAFMSTGLFEAKGSLSKLKLGKYRYEIPVQEIKTATALDLSGKGFNHLDAIVIAALIKVQTIAQNDLVTN